jgi:hypothetical protein
MKHSEVRSRLSDYLDRQLAPDERSRVDAHLGDCRDCGRELRELRATVALLQGLPEPPHPAGLGDAVLARIARGEGREARVVTLLRRATEPRWVAPLAAGLAGLFFLVEMREAGLPAPLPASTPLPANVRAGGSAPYSVVLGGVAEAAPPSRGREPAPRAGIIMGAAPALDYAEYVRHVERAHGGAEALADANAAAVRADAEIAVQHRATRRARVQEMARLLRGAGHPHSTSLATHFEPRAGVVLADWQPR